MRSASTLKRRSPISSANCRRPTKRARPSAFENAPVTGSSSATEKLALFRRLFAGRPDVFPVRWENARSGRAGYSPACSNEWVKGVCRKPKVKCGECPHQAFIPPSDEIIERHLRGGDARSGDFVAGVYPLLSDETCWFLAADFDKEAWADDARALLETCRARGVAAALERSRSGNGGHVWIFFDEPVPARIARQMGAALITETMERRPEIGFTSYDRFFPNSGHHAARRLWQSDRPASAEASAREWRQRLRRRKSEALRRPVGLPVHGAAKSDRGDLSHRQRSRSVRTHSRRPDAC